MDIPLVKGGADYSGKGRILIQKRGSNWGVGGESWEGKMVGTKWPKISFPTLKIPQCYDCSALFHVSARVTCCPSAAPRIFPRESCFWQSRLGPQEPPYHTPHCCSLGSWGVRKAQLLLDLTRKGHGVSTVKTSEAYEVLKVYWKIDGLLHTAANPN